MMEIRPAGLMPEDIIEPEELPTEFPPEDSSRKLKRLNVSQEELQYEILLTLNKMGYALEKILEELKNVKTR